MDSGDVRRTLDESLTLLTPAAGHPAAWTAPAGPLEWTCLATAEHIAHDLTAYATQLAARATAAYLPLDLAVRPGAEPLTVLRIVAACGRLLGLELDAAGPDARAWHWGPTDRTGFAALGVDAADGSGGARPVAVVSGGTARGRSRRRPHTAVGDRPDRARRSPAPGFLDHAGGQLGPRPG